MTYKFFLCAGELSGDNLAAGLIRALKEKYPTAQFQGIAGPHMVAAGCEALYSLEAINVMGLLEVIPKIPQILYLRHQLYKHLLAHPPDVYIGIDAPDFNLPLEAKLKAHGIKTVHYVSPTVWAWRSDRVKSIKKSVDVLLSVLPFEQAFYAPFQVNVQYVGHRSADYLPDLYTQEHAREILQLKPQTPVLTLLPGSRSAEIHYLADTFLQTAQKCYEQEPDLICIVAAAKPAIAKKLRALIKEGHYPFPITVVENQTHVAIKAADVVLVTSGTATLEVMLLDQPMVVAYKMNPLTWELARRLIKVKFCALPNLLANKALVPEFVQDDVKVAALSAAVLDYLQNQAKVAQLRVEYQTMVSALQCGADEQAARVISELIARK